MKRTILIIFILMLVFGPVNIIGSEVCKGYRGFVDATFDATSFKLVEDYDYTSFGLVLTGIHRRGFVCAGIATSHGYQFNPHIFAGLGVLGYRFNFGHKPNLNVGVGLNLQYRPDPGGVINYGHDGHGPRYTVVDFVSIQPYFDFKVGIDF